eukprot:s1244_g9.t1
MRPASPECYEVDLLSAPMPQSFQHMPWHEQAPLMYLGLVPAILHGLSELELPETLSASSPLPAGYDEHVVLLRQRALNSYPQELVQKTQHALVRRLALQMHLHVQDMYQRYHDEHSSLA